MAVPHDPADDAALLGHGASLADGIEVALPGWVERGVVDRMQAWNGSVPPEVVAGARDAGRRARAEIGPQVRALLSQDVDDQRSTPLAIVRTAVAYPTAVLRAAGVPPVERDPMAESAFPDDDYDLAPASFADLAPDLVGLGISWGAAKAHVILSRRRPKPDASPPRRGNG